MIGEMFKYNCSTIFMIKPIIGVNFGVLKDEFGMINSYLKDKSREDVQGDYLFILFKPIDFDNFESFLETQQEKNLDYIEDYDYTNGYVVILYKIPDVLKDDFELFKQGKYSKLSKLIKSCYDKEVKAFLKPLPGFQYEVFIKARRLKEELEEYLGSHFEDGMELWMLPDMEKECLDPIKLTNL